MTTPPVDTSTSPLLDLREGLLADLEATGYDVYLYGSAQLSTPCIVLEPNGWSPSMAARGLVAYTVKVTCLYNAAVATDQFDGVEELARTAYLACSDAGWLPTEVPAPGAVTFNERTFAGAQFVVGRTVDINS